jgi:hypothetical protein
MLATEITEAGDGEEALAAIAKQRPDLAPPAKRSCSSAI